MMRIHLLSLLFWLLLVSVSNAFHVPIDNGIGSRRRSVVITTASAATSSTSETTTNNFQKHIVTTIDGYDEAMDDIDQCSVSGIPSDTLYDSVRFLDKNARFIYPTLEAKEELWSEGGAGAFGSWKLQLATGGGKFTTFKPVPIFAFAMIDEINFGNGIGFNEDTIPLSLLGKHTYNTKIRQMIIGIDDMFLAGGNSVTPYLPNFIKEGMGLGKQPTDYVKPSRPPAFTMIGASDKSLVARGGSGGIAIWTRLSKDIRPAAYNYRK